MGQTGEVRMARPDPAIGARVAGRTARRPRMASSKAAAWQHPNPQILPRRGPQGRAPDQCFDQQACRV